MEINRKLVSTIIGSFVLVTAIVIGVVIGTATPESSAKNSSFTVLPTKSPTVVSTPKPLELTPLPSEVPPTKVPTPTAFVPTATQMPPTNTPVPPTQIPPTIVPTAVPLAAPVQSEYSCAIEKTCTQMSSCEEAYYHLNTCGFQKRDGDNDGVPCESICPGG